MSTQRHSAPAVPSLCALLGCRRLVQLAARRAGACAPSGAHGMQPHAMRRPRGRCCARALRRRAAAAAARRRRVRAGRPRVRSSLCAGEKLRAEAVAGAAPLGCLPALRASRRRGCTSAPCVWCSFAASPETRRCVHLTRRWCAQRARLLVACFADLAAGVRARRAVQPAHLRLQQPFRLRVLSWRGRRACWKPAASHLQNLLP